MITTTSKLPVLGTIFVVRSSLSARTLSQLPKDQKPGFSKKPGFSVRTQNSKLKNHQCPMPNFILSLS
ncbi:MAG: hypothetical protein F6J93_17640 [Oscillatoria sp. SIO1A7]|nr:hypothetical protein [Oscillatoria sp. SIO1A7]